jgi:hypothetical protein
MLRYLRFRSISYNKIHEAIRKGHVDIVRYLITEHNVDLMSPCVLFNGKPLQLAYQELGRHHPVTHMVEDALKEQGLYNEQDYYIRPDDVVSNEQVITEEHIIDTEVLEDGEEENYDERVEELHQEEGDENQYADQEYVNESESTEL